MDTEKFNTYSSVIFIELLYTSKKFLNKIKEDYEELYEIIKELVKSPSDENQEYLKSLYFHNENELKNFINSYLKENESEFSWTTFLKKYESVRVAGKFFKIDKTEKAYKEFVDNMSKSRWSFNYMSVAVENDKYVIFFA